MAEPRAHDDDSRRHEAASTQTPLHRLTAWITPQMEAALDAQDEILVRIPYPRYLEAQGLSIYGLKIPPGFCYECLTNHPVDDEHGTYHTMSRRESDIMHRGIAEGKLPRVDPWRPTFLSVPAHVRTWKRKWPSISFSEWVAGIYSQIVADASDEFLKESHFAICRRYSAATYEPSELMREAFPELFADESPETILKGLCLVLDRADMRLIHGRRHEYWLPRYGSAGSVIHEDSTPPVLRIHPTGPRQQARKTLDTWHRDA